MRTIIHLSDLHFGRIHEPTTAPLVQQIKDLQPHLVVVAGDLTQRARSKQFAAARRFLDLLPYPRIVVPGNHDVPAYNLMERFLQPLKGYRRYISDDLLPSYVDDEIAVFGLNSTRSLTTKYGELRPKDITRVCERLMQLPGNPIKIVVCHHPFELPPNHSPRDLIRNASGAMKSFSECGVEVILSGHLHTSHTSQTAQRYRIPGHSALIVQAGTATSNRYRGEPNSFNVLRLDAVKLVVERFTWESNGNRYALTKSEEFTRSPEGWSAKP